MNSYSKVEVRGHTAAKAVHLLVRDERPITRFTVGVNETFSNESQWIEKTSYIDVVLFGELATEHKDMAAGTEVVCSGRLDTESWTDKDSGKKRMKLQVVAAECREVAAVSDKKTKQPVTATA